MKQTKKYEFTNETKIICGVTLKRIKRLFDGKVGGWIEKEENLSQEGTCWVDGSARVYGSARVFGSAQVYGSAWVYGSAQVHGLAHVHGTAEVYGLTHVCDSAEVYGSAHVHGSAEVYGSAQVFELASVHGSARVHGSAQVHGSTHVNGSAEVFGSAVLVRKECLLSVTWKSYTITITPQNISIGCKLWTRGTFNKTYKEVGKAKGMSDELITEFKSIVKLGTKIVKRVK